MYVYIYIIYLFIYLFFYYQLNTISMKRENYVLIKVLLLLKDFCIHNIFCKTFY